LSLSLQADGVEVNDAAGAKIQQWQCRPRAPLPAAGALGRLRDLVRFGYGQ
jgi:hypothetical protein